MEEWTAAGRDLWMAGRAMCTGRFTYCRDPTGESSGPSAAELLHRAAADRRPRLPQSAASFALIG